MEEERAIGVLFALAQPTRLRLFRMLIAAGPDGKGAGDAATELGVSPSALSFHLKELTQSGVICRERVGRSIVYRVESSTVAELISFLTDDCCQGRPELCGFASGDQALTSVFCD